MSTAQEHSKYDIYDEPIEDDSSFSISSVFPVPQCDMSEKLKLKASNWRRQTFTIRNGYYLLSIFLISNALIFYNTYNARLSASASHSSFSISPHEPSNHLPNNTLIQSNVWQIYFGFTAEKMEEYKDNIASFLLHSPSHKYTLLDSEGARSFISDVSTSQPKKYKDLLPLFYAMSRKVVRADFLRYLLLAVEGGVYSDLDTEMLVPLIDWVPEEFKQKAKLIVGLESDSGPSGTPVPGMTYPVQFCQWTIAGAANHPVFWTMVDRILRTIKNRPFEANNIDVSDADVLKITGPAAWTEAIFDHLTQFEDITWRNLTGMREPMLIGDVLVLPIDSFASGSPHSGSSAKGTNGAFVTHAFHGKWRGAGE